MYLRLFFVTAVIFLTFSIKAAAGLVDPDIHWRVINTDHFTIIFDAKQEDLGRQYAEWAEQAFQLDTLVMPEHPPRTTVALLDNTDAANGETTPIPYPLIYAYPVLPNPVDNITDYGLWGRELLTHEYAHTLTFAPVHGFWVPLHDVFGTIVTPNVLLPRWYLEGLAVEMETRMSNNGRLRSPTFLATARALSLDHTIHHETLARANELLPSWPVGNRPYLFGSFMMTEIAHQGKGGATLNDLTQSYSRRLPFFMNGPLEHLLGMNYDEAFAQMVTRVDHDTELQTALIEKGGHQKVATLPQKGFDNHDPAISPDGNKLAYAGTTADVDQLVVLQRQPGENRSFLSSAQNVVQATSKNIFESRLSLLNNVQKISWFPDSRHFVFDSTNEYRRYYLFSDLYVYDIQTHKSKRLTHGLRAMEPTVSPDGKTIVFRQNLGGEETGICQINDQGGDYKILYQAHDLERVTRPEFISNHEIVFASRKAGHEFLKVFDLSSGKISPILTQYDPAQFPRWTKQGLMFVSKRTGVANLYMADRDLKSARPLTNSLTMVSAGDLDPRTGDLYFGAMTGHGTWIQTIAQNQISQTLQPPQISLPAGFDWPSTPQTHTRNPASLTSEDYSPWGYLYPHYWVPMVYLTEGGFVVDASTAISDPLDKHAYQADLAYDSILHMPSFDLNYQNNTTQVPVSLSYMDRYEYLYTSQSSLRDQQGSALADLAPAFHLSTNWMTALGWFYFRESSTDFLSDVPNSFEFKQTGPTAYISYTDLSQRGYQISPEQGSAYSLSYTDYMPVSRNYTNFQRIKVNGQVYVSSFLPQHHVIMAQLTGVASPGLRYDLLGSPNSEFNYESSLLQGDYLTRGYVTGTFIGRNVLCANLEYRFPIRYIFQGGDTQPIFTRDLVGYLVTDAVTLQGAYFNERDLAFEEANLGRTFVGSGFELHSDFSIGFQFPLTFVVGAYYAWDAQARFFPVSIMMGLGLQQ